MLGLKDPLPCLSFPANFLLDPLNFLPAVIVHSQAQLRLSLQFQKR